LQSVLVRNLEESVILKLKKRATRNGRSLQSEVKIILDDTANELDALSALEAARRIRASNTKRNKTNSADLIREDRMR